MTFSGSSPDFVAGAVIGGKLRIDRILGRGGMGVVVAAHHLHLDAPVAIKFLHPEMLSDSEVVARFARVARAAVKITSEHVARVLDVGTLDTGAPYIVMEFLEGRDLAAWLKESGPLPIEQAVEFLLHACDALAEAHSLGIVHRDLKPSNLFCIRTLDGKLSVKVLDFGISKLATAGRHDGNAVTQTVTLMGTPLYMSPEQMRSAKSADAQSDIWALGVILYELLCGQVPFDGDAITEIAVKVSTQRPEALRGIRGDVPRELEAVILRCLEKEKSRRYASVAELAVALQPFAPRRSHGVIERILGIARSRKGGGTLAAPSFDGAMTAAAPETSAPFSTSLRSSMPLPRTPRLAIVAPVVAIIVAAATVGGAQWFRRHPNAEGAASPPSASSSAANATLVAPPAPAALAAAPPASEPTGAAGLELHAPSTDHEIDEPAGRPAGSPVVAHAAPSGPGNGASSKVHGVTPPSHAGKPGVTPVQSPAHDIVAATPAHATPTVAPPPAAVPAGGAPAANCDPPYTLDDQGLKHFKPECYLHQ